MAEGAMPGATAADGLRETLAHRRERRRRFRLGLIGLAVSLPCLATIAVETPALFVWNVSASAPRGLYVRLPGARVGRGDMVFARLPRAVRALAATRQYLPIGVPLVKRVAAVPGDTVCATVIGIRINGQSAALLKQADPEGRSLPRWSGCRRLDPGQLLLLSAHPWSFDGRYFGLSQRSDVVGRARLIWPG